MWSSKEVKGHRHKRCPYMDFAELLPCCRSSKISDGNYNPTHLHLFVGVNPTKSNVGVSTPNFSSLGYIKSGHPSVHHLLYWLSAGFTNPRPQRWEARDCKCHTLVTTTQWMGSPYVTAWGQSRGRKSLSTVWQTVITDWMRTQHCLCLTFEATTETGGHGNALVRHSPPTSEIGVRIQAWPRLAHKSLLLGFSQDNKWVHFIRVWILHSHWKFFLRGGGREMLSQNPNALRKDLAQGLGLTLSRKAGSCWPLVGSLQYRTLTNCMYWFPPPFQLLVKI